jgi:hypothetical protein
MKYLICLFVALLCGCTVIVDKGTGDTITETQTPSTNVTAPLQLSVPLSAVGL